MPLDNRKIITSNPTSQQTVIIANHEKLFHMPLFSLKYCV